MSALLGSAWRALERFADGSRAAAAVVAAVLAGYALVSLALPLATVFAEGHEGFSVDDEEDWAGAERLVASGEASLPTVGRPSWSPGGPAELPRRSRGE